MPNGAYSLLAMVAPGMVWAYRKGSPRRLALYLPVITWWVVLQPLAWRIDDFPIYFIGAVGGLLLLAAGLHEDRSAMGIPYRFCGALLTAGSLIPLSYYQFHRDLGRWQPGPGKNPDFTSLVAQPLVIVVLAAGMVALAIAARRRLDPKAPPIPLADELREFARRQWLPVGVIVGMAGLAVWRLLTVGGESLLPTIAANVAMVVLALSAYPDRPPRRPRPALHGRRALLPALDDPPLQFDLFGDFGGMLGAALMFFLSAGGTLFGVAWFSATAENGEGDPTTATETEVTHAAV